MQEKSGAAHYIVGYWVFAAVWGALLALTWLTVKVSAMRLGVLSAVSPIAIATLKAGLVAAFFMHLYYEGRFIKGIILVALAIITVVVWLVYSDVAYRGTAPY